jgi:hypothetical protein
MINEFVYLGEIARKFSGFLGFISERTANTHTQVWRDLCIDNRWESDFKKFLAEKLKEYRDVLESMSLFDLRAQNKIREQELLNHFKRMLEVYSNMSRFEQHSFEELRFANAFQVLTLGYISATAWEYMKPDRSMDVNGFLTPFLSAGLKIEEVAQSVEHQGVTDSETFLQLLSDRAGGHRTPQPRPKDAILNNSIAVSLLDIMKDAGLLDYAYQWSTSDQFGKPIKNTNYKKATFAVYIANKADLAEWDKVFCDLWGLPHRTLSKAYDALGNKTPKTQNMYANMLSFFDIH